MDSLINSSEFSLSKWFSQLKILDCKFFCYYSLERFLSCYLSNFLHSFYFVWRIDFALGQGWRKNLSWKRCMCCRGFSIFLNKLNITNIEKTVRIFGDVVNFGSIPCLYFYLFTDFRRIIHIFAFFKLFFWIFINFFNISLFSFRNFI